VFRLAKYWQGYNSRLLLTAFSKVHWFRSSKSCVSELLIFQAFSKFQRKWVSKSVVEGNRAYILLESLCICENKSTSFLNSTEKNLPFWQSLWLSFLAIQELSQLHQMTLEQYPQKRTLLKKNSTIEFASGISLSVFVEFHQLCFCSRSYSLRLNNKEDPSASCKPRMNNLAPGLSFPDSSWSISSIIWGFLTSPFTAPGFEGLLSHLLHHKLIHFEFATLQVRSFSSSLQQTVQFKAHQPHGVLVVCLNCSVLKEKRKSSLKSWTGDGDGDGEMIFAESIRLSLEGNSSLLQVAAGIQESFSLDTFFFNLHPHNMTSFTKRTQYHSHFGDDSFLFLLSFVVLFVYLQ
jgi:hypothetical protein